MDADEVMIRLEFMRDNKPHKWDADDWYAIPAAVELIEKLRAQLPASMQDCTIVFKECAVGHGWLTATNWVDHGCPHCTLPDIAATADSAPAPACPTPAP